MGISSNAAIPLLLHLSSQPLPYTLSYPPFFSSFSLLLMATFSVIRTALHSFFHFYFTQAFHEQLSVAEVTNACFEPANQVFLEFFFFQHSLCSSS